MQSADKIFKGYRRLIYSDYFINKEDFIEAINKARIDAIKECANRALVLEPKYTEAMAYNNVSTKDYVYFDVDKESILSLIKEIK